MSHRRFEDAAGDAPLVVPVQRAGSASIQAIETIYLAHYRDVYRYLLGLTRSSDDAEEITSEVFERALRAWDGPPGRALPWLLLTARRIATDRWRRGRRLARILIAPWMHRTDDAGEQRTEFWEWFEAVSRVLTDHQREVLVLRYQRDLTNADIARIMGMSESGVRSLVARALEALRSHPELL
ncbi:MAG: sigma-70 family RNA polymerase sigma factor [Chloroflexi bacterium]|nr:sigma-70 family RNA polymerase sigma factor [Chloroflexota bacterium]